MSCTAFALSASTAVADEISDTIESALTAYQEGDVQYALEELAYATQQLNLMKAEGLSQFLPEAPDGWTREVNTDFSKTLGMMGGGVGAEANYTGNGEKFKITVMADNPMVAGMAGIFSGAGFLTGKMVRIGREKFIEQDNGQLIGLIGGRVLIQAEGASTETMVPILESIDLRGLSSFGN